MPEYSTFERIQQFFQAKLQPDDLTEAESLLQELQQELSGEPSVTMAGDIALAADRVIKRHAAKVSEQRYASFNARWPQARPRLL